MMEQNYRDRWIAKINAIGLTGLALTLLEGISPVRYLFAQCLLAATPFVTPASQKSWSQFASMLEDSVESHEFAGTLREKWT
jgi:hypothetical protein